MSIQRFGRWALRPSSGISFRTREPSCSNRDLPRNFEPNPLFDPQGYSALVSLVRLKEHRKAVVREEVERSGMADHIWKEKGNHLPSCEEVEIIDREENWKRRRLKVSAHMIGYRNLPVDQV